MVSSDEADRYCARQVGDGWCVYRWSTLEIAYVRGEAQVDLERDVAEAIAEHLTRMAGRSRARAPRAHALRAAA